MDSVSTTTSLLPEISPEVAAGANNSDSDSATAILVLSTVVGVAGSYVFGSAVGFSSPGQPRIVDDLGLTVAEATAMETETVGSLKLQKRERRVPPP
ncbi:sugar transporter ERD6-like 5 isoform X2 [Salvia splendens]|uniref:sugar transporter ERD6-like 5 isoform X2 n=1 Tax=Salvia splendens TaxID=180675 RepID=UPI001C273A9A|nr:sugar transporter ERD6-like 5 isoform X2 [Salvia splendens]